MRWTKEQVGSMATESDVTPLGAWPSGLDVGRVTAVKGACSCDVLATSGGCRCTPSE